MHHKVIGCALVGLFAVACSAAPVETNESIGSEAQAIRDKDFEVICPEWAPCTGAEEADDDQGGIGGMGGIGGSGEGGGSGSGGGHGGGGAGGGHPGGGGPAGPIGDANDFARCQGACIAGAPAIAAFCASIPVPQVQALCFANEFAGETMCMGFCYAWFLAG